jgi:hypothetical protein
MLVDVPAATVSTGMGSQFADYRDVAGRCCVDTSHSYWDSFADLHLLQRTKQFPHDNTTIAVAAQKKIRQACAYPTVMRRVPPRPLSRPSADQSHLPE